MDTKAKKVSPIHYLVVAAFCLGGQFIPGFAGITPLGMGILGCFVGAVYGWITIDMLWPSIVAMFGLGMTSIGFDRVIAGSFGNTTVMALILCMGVIGIAMTTGAFNWLASKLLGNKLMQGKPWVTIWVILFIAFLLGANNPIILMIIFGAFITSMLNACKVQKNSKLAVFTYLGTAFALMLGQILFPFISTGLVFYGAYMKMFAAYPMNMVAYLLCLLVVGVLMITCWVLVMKFVMRVDAKPLAEFCSDCSELKATRSQKIALIMFVGFIVVNVLAAVGPLKPYLSLLGLAGFCLFGTALMPFLKDEEGNAIGGIEELLHLCNWGQVTMVGFIMLLSTYMSGSIAGLETGIPAAMAMLFVPFMGMSPWVFVVIALVLAVVLTNFANNMIVGVMVMPLLVNYATKVGLDPAMVVVMLFIMAQFALATPAASPVTAVAMTQELADPTEMTKAACKILPIMIVLGLVIGLPVCNVIFSLFA